MSKPKTFLYCLAQTLLLALYLGSTESQWLMGWLEGCLCVCVRASVVSWICHAGACMVSSGPPETRICYASCEFDFAFDFSLYLAHENIMTFTITLVW